MRERVLTVYGGLLLLFVVIKFSYNALLSLFFCYRLSLPNLLALKDLSNLVPCLKCLAVRSLGTGLGFVFSQFKQEVLL